MKNLQLFRKIAIAEGFSFLLFALTMPLKYAAGVLWPNQIVGYIHGALFLLYVVFLLMLWTERNWTFKKVFLLFVASLLPFGTFVADHHILKKEV